jgi:hypothetical protein
MVTVTASALEEREFESRQYFYGAIVRNSMCKLVDKIFLLLETRRKWKSKNKHRNLRTRANMSAQVLQIFLGKEHLGKN